MSSWTRTAPLAAAEHQQQERWCFRGADKTDVCFDVLVTTGKPLDVVGLKNTSLREIRAYAEFLASTAKRLYGPDTLRRRVKNCPCCNRDAESAPEAVTIFGVAYVRCTACGHVFVGEQPELAAMTDIFAESDAHSQVYIDRATIEVRLEQVIGPKVDWTLSVFKSIAGTTPSACIDIGAGGGHFVEGLRRRGIEGMGYELSRASRDFARQAFGIELVARDFLSDARSRADIITMWGLLEYTPEPRRFLARARESMAPETGLLVVEVPRFDALGTVAQAANPGAVARHMDPTSHLNCFTEESLATALLAEGFRPVAAWYFGMDAYEMLVQAALRLDDEQAFAALADMIPSLQASCDTGRQCDDLVMAAVPIS